MQLTVEDLRPDDWQDAVLVGRTWIDGPQEGPRTCVLRDGALYDLSALAPTLSQLFDLEDPAQAVRKHQGALLGTLAELLSRGPLLAPCDLQAVRAAGVTFASSLIERVIEERARGDAQSAAALRADLVSLLGGSLSGVRPGSPAADRLRSLFMERGLWSQYLEVGIGPDPEVFTKCQPMSAVGCGASIGLHPRSRWNNTEPEVVLAVSSRGSIVGATLGNDLTMRDFEGRSALLLPLAKDVNASCAVGPFVRLFDAQFGLNEVRAAEVHVSVEGTDGYREEGTNSLRGISRDPAELVDAVFGGVHQYPDGLMLFLGTMYVPHGDRAGAGTGFTHLPGDLVRIRSSRLGMLVNAVTTADRAPPWAFGTRALMASLAGRGLL